jgi:GTP pyrophosphokinase
VDKVVTVSADGRELQAAIDYLSPPDRALVWQAYEFTRLQHGDQRRKTGEPFYTHPVTVAWYLAGYQLDTAALVAALLHDVAEDTRVSVEEIAALFGEEVAEIVDGVTKFEQSADDISHNGRLTTQQKNNATLRKLFRVMTRDVRVVLIKLFDRLHNMRTISGMALYKQVIKADETLTVYAPLANRLGMWTLKNELEAIAFRIKNRVAYDQISHQLDQRHIEHAPLIARVRDEMAEHLEKAGIAVATVEPSPRNVYSIYRRSQENHPLSGAHYNIDEFPRLSVVLHDTLACYTALGVLHNLWKPTPGDFDDYIARPRENLYQALHTTVIHSSGRPIKIRLRTEAMSITSEIGVLARWSAVAHHISPHIAREVTARVNTLLEHVNANIDNELASLEDSVQGIMSDVLTSQIAIHTPGGEIKELPKGATPIDFAYAIHSKVGDTCHMAYVNEEVAPLNTPLRDGDRVRIMRRGQAPQRHWLDDDLGYLKTTRSRTHVRRWFRRLPDDLAVIEGCRLLNDELAMMGLPDYPHQKVAEWLGHESLETLYHALGHADLLPTTVAIKVLTDTWSKGRLRETGRLVTSAVGERFIIVGAAEFSQIKLCLNCNPVPGNEILGFVRKDRRVTVHHLRCHLLPSETNSRQLLRLRWGEESTGQVRQVVVRIEVYDRPNLLHEITGLLREETVNIAWVTTPREAGSLIVVLCLEVNKPSQLVRLLHRMQAMVNVRNVRCLPDAHESDWLPGADQP